MDGGGCPPGSPDTKVCCSVFEQSQGRGLKVRRMTDGWTRISVGVPAGLEDLLGEALLRPPLTGIEQEDGLLRLFLSSEFDTAGFRERFVEEVRALGGEGVEFERMDGVDWEEHWRARWRPFRVGRCCIGAPDATWRRRPGDIPLRLLPGAAFGTGRHATTRGALLGLQRFDPAGLRILDAGCGSGILGVAAALLGAREVVGIDIDPNSPAAARTLARQNGVERVCSFSKGDLNDLVPAEGGFDGFVANLYYDLIQTQAVPLSRRLLPGAFFVFSGCRSTARERTRERIGAAGLAIEWEVQRGRWLAFAGRKKRLVPSEGLEPSTR